MTKPALSHRPHRHAAVASGRPQYAWSQIAWQDETLLWFQSDLAVRGPSGAHTHDFLEITIVMSGRVHYACQDGDEMLRSGDVRSLRPGEWHKFELEPNEHCTLLFFMIRGQEFTQLINNQAALLSSPLLASVSLNSACHFERRFLYTLPQLLHSLPSAQPTSQEITNILGFLNLYAQPGPATPGRLVPEWLEKAEEMLRTQWPAISSSQELATSLGISVAHLSRSVKKYFNKKSSQWILSIVLEQAKSQVLNSSKSVTEIANECGYSLDYFIRAFRKHYGTTPGALRQNRGLHEHLL